MADRSSTGASQGTGPAQCRSLRTPSDYVQAAEVSMSSRFVGDWEAASAVRALRIAGAMAACEQQEP